MAIGIENLWVFRIIPIQNLEHILREGLYCKNAGENTENYMNLGSQDVINRRDAVVVKCYRDTVVNDYIPFYFSIRTPMLYNIITGHGVPAFPQEDIVYLCCRLVDLTTIDFKWCYTNGNAAVAITNFYSSLDNIEVNLDWHSIRTTDFRDDNSDADEDRIRKKHAEFLVKEYVPVEYIKKIVVFDKAAEEKVSEVIKKVGLKIDIIISPGNKFYFS
jgi:hypothetical protein